MTSESSASATADTAAADDPLMISVIICTHNRADYLRSAIESVLTQHYPADSCELLVIDNKSTDATPAVVADFRHDRRVRYVYEDRLGLCHARNRGWREARGRYIVYLDDDAIAEPDWLASIEAAFAFDGKAGVVGGRVDPIWHAERPAWISDDIAHSLTVIDWGPDLKLIPDVRVQWLAGVNMAIPAEILSEVGGFDPRLDRIGTNMLSGGDVFLQKQIIERGYSCVYHPGMAVRHVVPRSRLEKSWFTRRYYWQGISDAVMELIVHGTSRRRRIRSAVERIGRLARRPRAILELVLPTDDAQQFQRRCFTMIEVGHIAGLLGVARA